MVDPAVNGNDPLGQFDLAGLFEQESSQQKSATAKIATDQAAADKEAAGLEDVDKQIAKAHEDRVAELSGEQQQADAWAQNEPQDQMKSVMQVSPLIMALAALAGGHTRAQSVTGLGALNGAMQGILKGDRQAYDDQMTNYQQQMKDMQARWDQRDKVYNELEKAYGDDQQGRMRRWTIANAAIGEDQKTAEASLSKMVELRTLEAKISEETKVTNARVAYYESAKAKAQSAAKGEKPLTPSQKLAAAKWAEHVKDYPMEQIDKELASVKKQEDIIRGTYPPGYTKFTAAEQAKLDSYAAMTEALGDRREALLEASMADVEKNAP